MRTGTVGSNEHHLTFEKYFARHFAKTTTEPLAAALAAGHFLLNGEPLRNAGELLKTGDEIIAIEADELQQLKPQVLQIVYEDEDILIVDKPYGMLSHPETGMREKDVLSVLRKSRDAAAYAPVNRLDYNTSGLMIVSKNRTAAYQLSAAGREKRITKTYLCVVSGYLPYPEAALKAYLLKDEESALVRIADIPIPGSKPIETKYRVLLEKGDLSLLEVELVTGRTHQIRAHLAFLGHPIIGDPLYGNGIVNHRYGLRHQALASYRLAFSFPESDHPLHRLDSRTWIKKEVDFLDFLAMKR